jgi:hypothetical protein
MEQCGGDISGDILIHKARQIWPRIPEYAHLETPTFSQGWLTRFKTRHNIKKRTPNSAARSVDLVTAPEDMCDIQTLCGQYLSDETFSSDETSFY